MLGGNWVSCGLCLLVKDFGNVVVPLKAKDKFICLATLNIHTIFNRLFSPPSFFLRKGLFWSTVQEYMAAGT